MTKKRRNLKQLFLFNGLLLLIAFILIQYSVINNTEEQEATESRPSNAGEENTSLQETENIYKAVLQGSFEERLVQFDQPAIPYNISFKNIVGRQMTLDDLKGQWVVLNFWASWCPPCITEMPSLQALQDQYGGQGVQVIGIGLDRQMDGPRLRQVMQKFNFGPVAGYYGDWTEIKKHFDIDALPTTYILSPNGQAVAKLSGHADWIDTGAKLYIESLID